MPRKEILHRVQEAAALRQPYPVATLPSTPLWRSHPKTSGKLLDVRMRFWSDSVAEHCSRAAAEAISGEIHVLGEPWSTVDKRWNVDPSSSYEWPAVSAHKLDYRHRSGADPKWIWEVNRLLFLVPVAFAMEDGAVERQSAETFVLDMMANWIESCQPGKGPQWSASIEVAIRALVMTLAIQAVEAPDETILQKVGLSVQEHVSWIKRFPSRYSSANNHRVAELAALLILHSAWSDVLAEHEVRTVERELATVGRALFALDGIGLEQSPTYSAFSIEFLSLALLSHSWEDARSREQTEEVLRSAANALAQFTNEDESFILWGDNDEGKVVTVAAPDDQYARAVTRLATGEGMRRCSGVLTFADGGMSIIRKMDNAFETTWSLDHGPLGFSELAAHGHADVLSVTLRSAGLDWIVDGGTYRYHGDKSWRTYFRSSRAHNAPQLNDHDSSVMTGDFNWHTQKRAVGKLIRVETGAEAVRIQATHDGYEKQGLGCVVRDFERVAEGHYRITDSHDGLQRLSTAFIFHPDCDIDRTINGWKITQGTSPLVLHMKVSGEPRLSTESPDDETAWFSPTFGEKRATWRLRAEAERDGHLPQRLVFDFFLSTSFKAGGII